MKLLVITGVAVHGGGVPADDLTADPSLTVGGLKEKVIAAHRAGIKTIIIPQENKKNLVKIPDEVKKDIKFKFVHHMDQVLNHALTQSNKTSKPKTSTKLSTKPK